MPTVLVTGPNVMQNSL